ncbi:MAG TPA: EamA family transporter, partial [Pseudonocardia sp.]|uniref:EamA family transporter n=1 Tax=Pseudonocardia sp. TaxID=60912 RepID=UPI002F42DD91
ATVTYLTPVFSTLLGAVLLAEPVGASTLAGGLLVVAGVLLARARPARPVERPTASASDRC